MKKRSFIILVLGMTLCLFIPVFASAVQQGTPTLKSLITAELFPVGTQATVGNCSHINVREGAGTGYHAFTTLKNGDVITVLAYSDKWVKLDTLKGQGWVYAGYLINDAVKKATASATNDTLTGNSVIVGKPTPVNQITADMFPVGAQVTVAHCYFLNVRSGPAKTHNAFTAVAKGDTFTVLEYNQKWVKIDTAKGQGWIYAGYVSLDGGTTTANAIANVSNNAASVSTADENMSTNTNTQPLQESQGSDISSDTSNSGDYTLAQLNMAADAIYDSAIQQFQTYESYGIPVPDSAYSTLNQAYESYQTTVSIADQTGLSNDPAVTHAHERMEEIRQLRGY